MNNYPFELMDSQINYLHINFTDRDIILINVIGIPLVLSDAMPIPYYEKCESQMQNVTGFY